MIFKSSHPGSPNVSVVLSGVSVDYTTIQSVTVDIQENMHDMADWIVTELSSSPILVQYTLADIETNHMYYLALWLLHHLADQRIKPNIKER